jgi:hypothetical protein
MKGFIAFLVLVVAPIVFWVGEKGLSLRQDGYGWVPFASAPVLAAIFAFVVSGAPGKKLVGSDDQGQVFVGRFWAVFILLTVALLGVAFLLKQDA